LPNKIEEQLAVDSSDDLDSEGIEDDQLRLIFTCCHPALPSEAQVALTLREVCGLTTEDIASAFLVSAPKPKSRKPVSLTKSPRRKRYRTGWTAY
jgi:RNA polymerase sigma-70 factor, ECF subfamily